MAKFDEKTGERLDPEEAPKESPAVETGAEKTENPKADEPSKAKKEK